MDVGVLGGAFALVTLAYTNELLSCELRTVLTTRPWVKLALIFFGCVVWYANEEGVPETSSSSSRVTTTMGRRNRGTATGVSSVLLRASVLFAVFVFCTRSRTAALGPAFALAVLDQLLLIYVRHGGDWQVLPSETAELARRPIQVAIAVILAVGFASQYLDESRRRRNLTFAKFVTSTPKCRTRALKRA